MGEEHHGAVEISYTGEHDPGRIGAEIPPLSTPVKKYTLTAGDPTA